MKFGEAVKIERASHLHPPWVLDQARAVVDAAVKAHEARVECDREWRDHSSTNESLGAARDADMATYNKLRALERGEDA